MFRVARRLLLQGDLDLPVHHFSSRSYPVVDLAQEIKGCFVVLVVLEELVYLGLCGLQSVLLVRTKSCERAKRLTEGLPEDTRHAPSRHRLLPAGGRSRWHG